MALPLPSGARRAAYYLALMWVEHSWTAPAACRIEVAVAVHGRAPVTAAARN